MKTYLARNWLVHHRPFALTSPPTNPHPHPLQLSLRRCERERNARTQGRIKRRAKGAGRTAFSCFRTEYPFPPGPNARVCCVQLIHRTPSALAVAFAALALVTSKMRRFQNLCFEIFKPFYSAYGGGAPLPQGESLSSAPPARFLVEPGAWTRVRLTEL